MRCRASRRTASEPVKIRAASLEVRDKEQQATFSGDVHVIQGDTEMRCKTLVIFYEEEPGAASPRPAGDARPGPASRSARSTPRAA